MICATACILGQSIAVLNASVTHLAAMQYAPSKLGVDWSLYVRRELMPSGFLIVNA